MGKKKSGSTSPTENSADAGDSDGIDVLHGNTPCFTNTTPQIVEAVDRQKKAASLMKIESAEVAAESAGSGGAGGKSGGKSGRPRHMINGAAFSKTSIKDRGAALPNYTLFTAPAGMLES
jgi:hypothetical protein